MRRAVDLLVVAAVLVLSACGGNGDDADDTGAATSTSGAGEIVIETSVAIAAEEGAETIATGEVLDGSTLGGSAFCVGGTIRDTHASADPEVFVIARTITCPDGTVRVQLRPDVDAPPGETQTGSWTIVGGTGDFEGLGGSGDMEVVYGPDEGSPARETLSGTVTRGA